MTESAPLLVLGCHRSGTSAVTGLLHEAAGLFLGDTLPPGEDNPKGYFESLAIVEAHKYILLSMGRDWTCPPTDFTPDAATTALIREALTPLLEQDRPWAVKDPRLLFMLPPWTEVLSEMRFVGVIRDAGSVAKSIATRNQIPLDGANQIVSAYMKRLADVHRAMPFPVIAFDDDYANVISRVGELARQLGLVWDEDAARKFFTPSLVHHQGDLSPDENYRYLLEESKRPVAEPETYPSAKVTEVLDSATARDIEELPTFLGPRFVERRQYLWGRVAEDAERVDGVLELLPSHSADVPLYISNEFDAVAQMEIPTESQSFQRLIRRVVPPSHIIGAGIIESLDPDELAGLITDLDLRSRTHAVMQFDGPVGSRDILNEAIADTSWSVDSVEVSPANLEVITITKRSDVYRQSHSAVDPEKILLSIDARVCALERDFALSKRAEASAQAQEEIRVLSARNQDLERHINALSENYDRLINRRAVRTALKLALLFKPLVRLGRKRPPAVEAEDENVVI